MIFLGIILFGVGYVMLRHPDFFYEITESWKGGRDTEPSDLYKWSTRFGGLLFLIVGLAAVIVFFYDSSPAAGAAVKYDASELRALKKIIKEQNEKESFMPKYTDGGAYHWKKGHLVKISLKNPVDLHGALDLKEFPELKVFSCAGGAHLTSLDFRKNKKLMTLYCSDYGKTGSYVRGGLKKLRINGCSSLKTLDCSKNNLRTLNLKNCKSLETVNCSDNDLTKTLDFSSCKDLKSLDCGGNEWINELEISSCKKLVKLDCSRNSLRKIDIKGHTKLKKLDCSYNEIKKLDVSNNTRLTELSCHWLKSLNLSKNTRLKKFKNENFWGKSLDLSKNKKLEILELGSDYMKTVDLSKNTALRKAECRGKWKTLNFSKNKKLETLVLYCSDLEKLDLSGNKKLKVLKSSSHMLTSLDLGKAVKLERLECGYGRLKSLDLRKNKALKTLDIYHNELTSLQVDGLTKLKKIDCDENKLKALDLAGDVSLTSLDCRDNELTALDFSDNPALTKVHCTGNQLRSLDVSKNKRLKVLYCDKNQISSMDVSGNPALKVFVGGKNKFTSLKIGSHSNLTKVACEKNELTALAISGNPVLKELNCEENKIAELDLTGDASLEILDCTDNELTSLDVSGCTGLTDLYCTYNRLKVLDVSKNRALVTLMTDSADEDGMEVIGDVTAEKDDIPVLFAENYQVGIKNYETEWQDNGYDASDTKVSDSEKENWENFPIEKAKVTKKDAFQPGDRIDFSVVISDKRTEEKKKQDEEDYDDYPKLYYNEVGRIVLGLRSEESDQQLYVDLNIKKKRKDGTVFAKGGFTVRDGMQSGKWIVAAMFVNPERDYSENSTLVKYVNRFCNGNMEFPDLSWGDFTVKGTKADLSFPVMKDYKVVKNNADQTVTISFRASDESEMRAYVWAGYDEGDSYDEISEKDGVYSLKAEASILDYSVDYRQMILLGDFWGNEYYFDQTLKKTEEERIQKVLGNSEVEVKSISAAADQVKAGEACKITVNMEQKDFTMEKVKIVYTSPYDDAYQAVVLKKGKKDTVWTGEFKTKETALKGNWRVESVMVSGKNSKGEDTYITLFNRNYLTKYNNRYHSLYGSVHLWAELKGGDVVLK